MRILFVNRIAWPDEGATALYLTDVAEACAAAGHEVHVLCGTAGYRTMSRRRPVDVRIHAGVRYHRITGARGVTILGRVVAAMGFLSRVMVRMARLPRPDVVVAMTDPPFVDVFAGAMGRLRGARTIHWLMDAYPDVAVAAGVLREGSPLHRALGAAMACALRRAHAVIVLAPSMRRPVLMRGVTGRRVHVIENWAPGPVEAPMDAPRPHRSARPTTLMYSGTYGVAHDLRPLLDALRALPRGVQTRLILQASGSRLAELRTQVADLPVDVVWRDPVPLASLADSLREADIHVASVAHGFERLVMPSKIYAPLALGLPVLALGSAGGWARSRRTARATVASAPGLDERTISWMSSIAPLVVRSARWPRPRADGIRRWVHLIEMGAGPLSCRARRLSAPHAAQAVPDSVSWKDRCDPASQRRGSSIEVDLFPGGDRAVSP